MDTGNRKNIELARRILAAETVKIEEILGEETGPTAAAGVEEGYAAALFKLAMRLKKEGEFGYAHKILNWARKISVTDPALRFRLRQQQALCIYKDPLLPLGQRLDWALEVLGQEEDLRSTQNPETLGLAGAIYKRKWEADGQKQNLEQSLAYFLRGYEAGPENDNGYTAINAAYILDLLSR